MAFVYSCNRCENFHLQPLGTVIAENDKTLFKNSRGPPVGPNCTNCGSTFNMGGPIYTAPIHNSEFVSSLQASLKGATQLETTDLPNFEANQNSTGDFIPVKKGSRLKPESLAISKFQTLRRMQGVLNVISEELPDVPLHVTQEKLSQVLRVASLPLMKLRSALMNAGYRVSSSHTNKTSVKTDAPHDVVWDIMRQWVIDLKLGEPKDKESAMIMSHPIKTKVDFTERADAVAPSMKDRSLRFQHNPERNWGPKARATASDDVEEKRKRLQGKKKKRKEVAESNGDHDSPLDASVEGEDTSNQLKKPRQDEQVLLENKGQTA